MDYAEKAISPDMMSGDLDTVPSATDPVAAHEASEELSAAAETTAAEGEASLMPDSSDETVYCPVYNGQTLSVKASDREEITALLQLGMKQRDFLPTYERLSFLAKEDGASSVKTWVEQLVKDREEAYREAAVRAYGEEAGQRYYEMERREREQRYTARDAEQTRREETARTAQAQHERLASELIALQEQYPQYRYMRDVPQAVVEAALREHISLLDAHNRFLLTEQQRREREQTQSRAEAARSTGSLRGEPSSAPSAMEAFLKGLHSRV